MLKYFFNGIFKGLSSRDKKRKTENFRPKRIHKKFGFCYFLFKEFLNRCVGIGTRHSYLDFLLQNFLLNSPSLVNVLS